MPNIATKPNTTPKPNIATNGGKTYVSGGTTKDNPIVLSKPKRNYLMYTIVVVLSFLVINKLFINKN